jgi:hypothetical protein
MTRRACVALGLALVASGGTARAEGVVRAVLVHAEGPDAEGARREVVAALPEGTREISPSAAAAAWRESAAGRARSTDGAAHLARAARAAHADAAILVTATAGARAMHLTVLDTGARSEVTLSRHGGEALARTLAGLGRVDDADAAAETPPPAAAPLVTQEAPAAAPGALAEHVDAERAAAPPPGRDGLARPSAARADPGRATLDVYAGLEIGARDFRYTDRRSPALRDYALAAAPLVAVGGEAYPFAASGQPFIADLGVAGDYARAFALSSGTSSGSAGAVSTAWSRFDLGARFRVRLGEGGHLLRVSLAYGEESFALATFGALGSAALPSVAYRYILPGVDVRLARGRFALHGGGAYLAVLGGGPVADRFPSSSLGGIEARLGLAVTVARGLELRADADYRRYFYALHPAAPGSTYVAGGALDQLAGVTMAVALLL